MKLDGKKEKLVSKYTEDQVRKSSVLVDSVMVFKRVVSQRVERLVGGKKFQGKKIFGFVENEWAE